MTTLLCMIALLGADGFGTAFDNAVDAYQAEDYAQAATLFQQLVDESVVDPAVFYNLGNAYYRSGRLAHAIANYERALQLDPAFENARKNLDKAVADTPNRLAKPLPSEWEQSLLFWHYSLPPWATCLIAVVLWIALWGIFALRQWRPVRYSRAALLILAVLVAAFGASAWSKLHPAMLAVASEEVVPVHYGTDERETVYFNLNEGDRVRVDKRLDGWARVTTIDNKRGWAQESGLVFVGPPYAAESDAGREEAL